METPKDRLQQRLGSEEAKVVSCTLEAEGRLGVSGVAGVDGTQLFFEGEDALSGSTSEAWSLKDLESVETADGIGGEVLKITHAEGSFRIERLTPSDQRALQEALEPREEPEEPEQQAWEPGEPEQPEPEESEEHESKMAPLRDALADKHSKQEIEFARRLARAIASDIRLYHEGETNLVEPIAEGRDLFLSRADRGLEPLFDEAIDELIPDRKDTELSGTVRLVVTGGEHAGQVFLLDGERTIIGRTEDADVVIPHRSLSREHAEIIRQGDTYVARDLESANGISVNNKPVVETRLHIGDRIQLGEITLLFTNEDVEEQPPQQKNPWWKFW